MFSIDKYAKLEKNITIFAKIYKKWTGRKI